MPHRTADFIEYEPKVAYVFPRRRVVVTLALGMACVLAMVGMPVVMAGFSPLVASVGTAAVVGVLLCAVFYASAKCRRNLRSTRFRPLGLILILAPLFLTPVCVFDVIYVAPKVAGHVRALRLLDERFRAENAFEKALLVVNISCLEAGAYPPDLGVLLRSRDASLAGLFPKATSGEMAELKTMAALDRPLTPAELDVIGRVANLDYHASGRKEEDKGKHFVVLSSRVPQEGFRFVGFSSDKVVRVRDEEFARGKFE